MDTRLIRNLPIKPKVDTSPILELLQSEGGLDNHQLTFVTVQFDHAPEATNKVLNADSDVISCYLRSESRR